MDSVLKPGDPCPCCGQPIITHDPGQAASAELAGVDERGENRAVKKYFCDVCGAEIAQGGNAPPSPTAELCELEDLCPRCDGFARGAGRLRTGVEGAAEDGGEAGGPTAPRSTRYCAPCPKGESGQGKAGDPGGGGGLPPGAWAWFDSQAGPAGKGG